MFHPRSVSDLRLLDILLSSSENVKKDEGKRLSRIYSYIASLSVTRNCTHLLSIKMNLSVITTLFNLKGRSILNILNWLQYKFYECLKYEHISYNLLFHCAPKQKHFIFNSALNIFIKAICVTFVLIPLQIKDFIVSFISCFDR